LTASQFDSELNLVFSFRYSDTTNIINPNFYIAESDNTAFSWLRDRSGSFLPKGFFSLKGICGQKL